jgi:hypothetical protein
VRARFSGTNVGGVLSGGGRPLCEVGYTCNARFVRSWMGEAAVFCFLVVCMDGRVCGAYMYEFAAEV